MTQNNEIMQRIHELEVFLECDLWYSSQNEWKSEEDVIKYIRTHFKILRREIEELHK